MIRFNKLLLVDGIGLLACLGVIVFGHAQVAAAGMQDVLLLIAGGFVRGLLSAHQATTGPVPPA